MVIMIIASVVGAFSVIVKTHCETDGALHSTNLLFYPMKIFVKQIRGIKKFIVLLG